MLNRNIIFLLCVAFLIQFSSAIELGLHDPTQPTQIQSVQQGQDKVLYQTCNNCTYCNISRITTPSNNSLFSNLSMTQDRTYFSYTLDGTYTEEQGHYSYFYDCGNATESLTGQITFDATPSGREGDWANIIFTVLMVVVIYTVTLIFFFGRNAPLSIISGMAMSYFGVWIINNGVIIFRDSLTNYLGYITIGIGAVIALWAGIEWGMEEVF